MSIFIEVSNVLGTKEGSAVFINPLVNLEGCQKITMDTGVRYPSIVVWFPDEEIVELKFDNEKEMQKAYSRILDITDSYFIG